jgi:phosphomannomutase/phosphoglucomutase
MLKLKKNKPSQGNEAPRAEAQANAPQGISAQGNALRSICLLALVIALVPTALVFIYLLLLREPALEGKQLDKVAAAYAAQQAHTVEQSIDSLHERIRSAAKSPLAMSAISNRSDEDIALVERAMLDYFPEVVSLRVIPIGDMGTADFSGGNRGLRNHIEVDLVRRASEGTDTEPTSYKFEDQWLTSIATRVIDARVRGGKAVIIVTLANDQLKSMLGMTDAGRFALEQVYNPPGSKPRTDVIAAAGSASGKAVYRADIADSSWRIAFTPSAALVDKLNASQVPLYIALAVALLAIVGSIAVILSRFPKTLEAEVGKVISSADKKASLVLAVPELVAVAKQLRRATLRALRQSRNAPAGAAEAEGAQLQAQPADLASPLFQAEPILDNDEESLDLDLSADDVLDRSPAGIPGFPEHVFRAYDIRGIADTELTDDFIGKVGRAIGTLAGERGEQALVVGCDGRNSSPRIKSALIRALMESGRDVIDIGLVPTPLLYFATRHLDYKSGVMITGSHNPSEHNGLKIVLGQETIAAGGIQQIRDLVVEQKFSSGNGRMTKEDVVPAYLDAVLHDVAIAVPLKIVIDAGNGATSEIAPNLFEELGCEVIPLHCKIDGNFPNHAPDTSNEDNLSDLVKSVQVSGADFGVAFDGDGDRLAVVTGDGDIVRSDVLLMVYAQDVVSRNPGADVVFDVKCSRNLTDLITRNGGRPVLWKTGHAFMKEKMRETGALLGGEFSGHMFFGERWYGFDDGMYAAARLAEILSTHGQSLEESISQFPSSINTPEILVPVREEHKFEVVERLIAGADFSAGKVTTMDGLRVDFDNGWGLIRASNTGPALTARFEADTPEALESIKDEFRAQLALIDPEIDPGF